MAHYLRRTSPFTRYGPVVTVCTLLVAISLVVGCSDKEADPISSGLQGDPNDVTLSSLVTSITGFPGGFASGNLSYATTVDEQHSSITITATSRSDFPKMTLFYGSGQSVALKSGVTSAPIQLTLGTNIFSVQIVGEDGSSRNIYTLTINKIVDPG
ncbi:cadherin-like beta sandwich domain-containing protein [Gemmatimonas aurantiaca]|nr:cadherin-like beta sandwich domain-containing protein [Gemmatimonas aurantiaca]